MLEHTIVFARIKVSMHGARYLKYYSVWSKVVWSKETDILEITTDDTHFLETGEFND